MDKISYAPKFLNDLFRGEKNRYLDQLSAAQQVDEANKLKAEEKKITLPFDTKLSDTEYDGMNLKKFPLYNDSPYEKLKKYNDSYATYPNKADIWFLKWYTLFVSGSAAASAFYIIGFYRRSFRLGRVALMSMYGPILYFSGVTSGLCNELGVMQPIIMRDITCPICLNLRSAAIQGLFSTVFPFFMTSFHAVYIASYSYSYPLPENLFSNRIAAKETFQIWKKITMRRGGIKVFGTLFVLNCLLGYFISYQQQQEYFKMYLNIWNSEKLKIDRNSDYLFE